MGTWILRKPIKNIRNPEGKILDGMTRVLNTKVDLCLVPGIITFFCLGEST